MVQQRNFNNCFSTINIVYYCNVLYQQLYQHCLLIGTSGCSDNSCPKCTCSGSNTTTSMRQRQYLRRSYRWYRRRSDIDMVCICTGCNTTSRNCTSLRSEEHTSELQSRPHLVCRLLLEKKKINNKKEK